MKLVDLPSPSPRKAAFPSVRSDAGVPFPTIPLGDVVETHVGTYIVIENSHGNDRHHGSYSFGDLNGLTGRQFALLCADPELAYVDLSRSVFLDTETTGLGMGVGTYVFLVGAGYYDGDAFRVRQFFLRSPGDERAFLDALDAFLRQFSTIVTFNGKAFDWPLLETRYTYHRRPMPMEDPQHLDLLHPARRLWKRRLESCALSSLERTILEAGRTEEDVPGWMIPSLYFEYQRSGNPGPLHGVFYHNLQDILSLAILAVHMDRVMEDPLNSILHAIDAYSLGRAFERCGQSDTANQCYEEALMRGLNTEERSDCLRRLSMICKRERRWHEAMQTWYRLIDEGGEDALFALVEMAKYHEHTVKDYDQALEDVQEALMLLDLHGSGLPEVDRVDLDHRLGRLLNKCASGRARAGRR